MGYSLQQIYNAIEALPVIDGDKVSVLDNLRRAMDAAKDALDGMDALGVVTRGCVDTLLGCMMATEAIIGKGDSNG